MSAEGLGPLLLGASAASFLGSLHCVGMCGPLVGACVVPRGAGAPARPWLAQAAYQGGRLLTLVLLGALAGALGGGVDALGAHAGLQRAVTLAAGTALVLAGLLALGSGHVLRLRLPAAVQGRLTRLVAGFAARPPYRRALLLGLCTPLLPCGWLWLFVLAAAGTGGAAAGALFLAAFWAGNLPALVGAGALLARLAASLRGRLPALGGALLVLVGALLILERAPLAGAVTQAPAAEALGPSAPAADAPAAVAPASSASALPSAGAQRRLPCCGAQQP